MCEILPDEGSGKSGVKQFIMEKLCRIRDIYRSIVEFETEFEHTFGLSLNEGMLLCSLKNNGKLTSGHIAEMLGLVAAVLNPQTSHPSAVFLKKKAISSGFPATTTSVRCISR